MAQYNIAEAKARLSELLKRAQAGEQIVIARDHKPLVKLVPVEDTRRPRKPGSAGDAVWMAPDFDETPEDFEDYL